jgi:hypothetical protein
MCRSSQYPDCQIAWYSLSCNYAAVIACTTFYAPAAAVMTANAVVDGTNVIPLV